MSVKMLSTSENVQRSLAFNCLCRSFKAFVLIPVDKATSTGVQKRLPSAPDFSEKHCNKHSRAMTTYAGELDETITSRGGVDLRCRVCTGSKSDRRSLGREDEWTACRGTDDSRRQGATRRNDCVFFP